MVRSLEYHRRISKTYNYYQVLDNDDSLDNNILDLRAKEEMTRSWTCCYESE